MSGASGARRTRGPHLWPSLRPAEALPPPPPVEPALDATAKLQPPSPPSVRHAEAPPVPPPRRRRYGALREEAGPARRVARAPRGVGHIPPGAAPIFENAACLSGAHCRLLYAFRVAEDAIGRPVAGGQDGAAGPQGLSRRAVPEVASGPGIRVEIAATRSEVAVLPSPATFLHTGVASNLFDRFATAVLVVEFYLTDDQRVMEPPVAVDP